MSLTTKIRYTNSDGTLCTKTTRRFHATTLYGEILTWIAEWWGHRKFYIEIKDEFGEFVDFDQIYFDEFHPYRVDRQTQNSGAQPTTKTPPFIELLLKKKHNRTQNFTQNGLQQASNAILSTDVQQSHTADSVVEQPQDDREPASSSSYSSRLYSFDGEVELDKDGPIKFEVDVNHFLRDQYDCEKSLVCIQGSKKDLEGNALKKKVEPKVKIQKEISPEEIHNWNLIILEAIHKGHPRKRLGRVSKTSEIFGDDERGCLEGKRTLFYNAWRDFVISGGNKADQTDLSINDVTQKESQECTKLLKKYVKIPLTKTILEVGVNLSLQTQVIPGTKTHSQPMKKFCSLANRYSDDTEYATDRLALLLENNEKPLWNTLALSKSMAFGKKKEMIQCKEVSTIDREFCELIAELKMKRKKNFNQPMIELKRLQKARQPKKHCEQTMATSLVTSHEALLLNDCCLQRVENLTSFYNQQSQEANIPMGMQHHIEASSDRMTINRSISKELATSVVQLIAPVNFQVSNTENLLDKIHQELDDSLEQPKLTQNIDNSRMEIDLGSQNGNVNGTHVNSSLYSNHLPNDLNLHLDFNSEETPEYPDYLQDLGQVDPNTNAFSETIENLSPSSWQFFNHSANCSGDFGNDVGENSTDLTLMANAEGKESF
ncbi:unnamed protein product [Rotaria magnacalcarata]